MITTTIMYFIIFPGLSVTIIFQHIKGWFILEYSVCDMACDGTGFSIYAMPHHLWVGSKFPDSFTFFMYMNKEGDSGVETKLNYQTK